MYTSNDHCFVICAYKDSPYLEDCMRSLKNQSVTSRVLLVTSTPSHTIEHLCSQYDIPFYINTTDSHGIGGDWNFALSRATTQLVTIAHQDDVYKPRYVEELLAHINAVTDPLLYFSGYAELRGTTEVCDNRLLGIKRLMLMPLQLRPLAHLKLIKRLILAFGNPICCPAVTYVMHKFTRPLFETSYGSNLDWQTWEFLSRKQGTFVYNPKPLMCHRIHEGSETSRLIENNKREQEDLSMLKRFWPTCIARAINKLYVRGQQSNKNS